MSNTIIRARRRHRFLILDQRAVEDATLSWAARGLLAYLLSRPDNWRVLVNDLRNRGDLGRDGIYRLLKELKVAGYVQFVRKRGSDGRIRGGTYYVREIPDSPHPDFPDKAGPVPVLPDPVKPGALPSTEDYLLPTTTTPPNNTKEGSSCRSHTIDKNIDFAPWVSHELRREAATKVSSLTDNEAQIVIDEWAGIMATGRIERSPLGYLHELVARLGRGNFRPRYADEVAEIRREGSYQ